LAIQEQTQPGELTHEQEQDLNERELRAVRNFIDYNRGVPIPLILRSHQLSRAQFYRDLKIAAKLWNFDPEAIRHRALFNVSEYMRINMARYEEARQAGTAAQQELDAAGTPENQRNALGKVMSAKNDEHFYWAQMGQVVRNSIEGAKLVMPKPETTTTITGVVAPGGVGIEVKRETRTAKQIMDELRAKGEL
jgi:hypothetical protein